MVLLPPRPGRLYSFVRSTISGRDIPDPPARLSTPPVVQSSVVESGDGQRELLLCVDVGVRDCERGGADGLRVGGVEDCARRDEGRV